MIHNKYTLSIDRYVLCFEDASYFLWIKIPLFRKFALLWFNKFVKNQNNESSKEDVDSILNDKYKREEYAIRLDILNSIYYVLETIAKSLFMVEMPKDMVIIFRKYIGHDFDTENFEHEIKTTEKKIKKTLDTLNLIDDHLNKKSNEPVNMPNLIFNIQDLIGSNHGDIGKQKVYKLPLYIKKAAQLINKS